MIQYDMNRDYIKEYVNAQTSKATYSKLLYCQIVENIIEYGLQNKFITEKQCEILKLNLCGKTQSEIAAKLNLSQPTISKSIIQSSKKLNQLINFYFSINSEVETLIMELFERCKKCPLKDLCKYNKRSFESCDDMVRRYNAGLLLPVEAFENSSF